MDNFKTEIYIEDKALFDYAASSARLMQPIGTVSARQALHLLQHSISAIKRSHSAVEKRCGNMASPPAACCWLLDNMYIARREYISAAAAFQGAKRLRSGREGILILSLCRSLISASKGKISADRCRLFLDGFQSVTVLKRSELDLFSAAMQASLLERLAFLSKELCSKADTAHLEKDFEAVFTSLRLLAVMDMEKLISGADISGAILSAEPSGEFKNMDSDTKRLYLKRLSRLAKKWGMEEHKAAELIIKQAKAENKHVGFILFESKSKTSQLWYIGANLALSLVISLYIALYFDSAAPALLLLLPVSELVKNLLDFTLLHIIPPRPLPRMDSEKISGSEGKSICVISSLLTDEESITALTQKLERFYHTVKNSGNISFGILADLKPAEKAELFEDKALINSAKAEINNLNRKYNGGFYLFTRERLFDGESFSGFERKRGAITELAKLLNGEKSALKVHGSEDMLYGTNYIISLDSDTEVYPGSLQQLVCAMLHPLNRAKLENGRVVQGHGIIHPRISNSLSSCHKTDFALIYSGSGGSDPYGSLCSELYMDAFSSGGFAGKGIIDVKCYLSLEDILPKGRILSHDALEGAYLRGAFMGDSEFCDSFPKNALEYYKRQHRWVRGDWQNAAWIFSNDLAPIERWRLFDSLRRSMTAPSTLLALLMGFFFPKKAIAAAAWAALLAILSSLILSFAEESLKDRSRKRIPIRRFTRVLGGTGGAIVQSFMRLWLLPYEAWVNLNAAVTALWRMFVSGKKLLQWQTAAQCKLGGFAEHIRAMLPAELLGFILLISAPGIMGRAAGLMWLISPAAAIALSLPAKKSQELSAAHREYLRQSLEGSWQYLAKFSSKEDNYLPPDNYQQSPVSIIAHRSSPTNMGFALSSAVAAADMELCSKSEAIAYMERLLTTLEKLPKAIGHFYNWYDTKSLAPLEPAFISTVDSGNMYAALLVAKTALEEWGERALSARVENIMAEMDFAPLYDKSRRLFYICYDTGKKQGAGGWYDLMASESMLTSYIAVSKGDVPVKHWRQLSRAQVQQEGYRGLASWTGTMFEYLMPQLFLPFYGGSLLWESGRFCLRAQKKRAFAGKPWGISESAFYSLDSSLSYRYKAHGVPALALKRGQEADMVISPYSSYLALAVDPHSAVKNLRRLEAFGALGRYGFIEAIDFTPDRCRESQGEKVNCYMAHHVGMSLMAGANALCNGSICRRFMTNASMAAHCLLLQEQIPSDPAVISRRSADVQERPPRSNAKSWSLRSQESKEAMTVLSNGVYHLVCDSSGNSFAKLNERAVWLPDSFKVSIRSDSGSYPVFPDPQPLLWELSESEAKFKHRCADINCQSQIYTAAGDFGEVCSFTLSTQRDQNIVFSLSFSPILARLKDYVNHTEFWKLGIHAKREGHFILVQRLRRADLPELWLCIGCNKPMDTGTLGYLNSALDISLKMKLLKGAKKEIRFVFCLADSSFEALEGAKRLLQNCDKGCMVSAAACRLEMSNYEIGRAMALLPHILNGKTKEAAAKKELWKYGISGDRAIVCCDVDARESLSVLKQFCLLKSCGVDFDLVYLSKQMGEYEQPAHKSINNYLSKMALDALMGSFIHIAPMDAAEIIKSRAVYNIGKAPLKNSPAIAPLLSAPRQAQALPQYTWDGDFEYYVNRNLPSRSWQHILSNGSFSAIVRDCGMAALWLHNAREMPLVKQSSIDSVENAESLWAQSRGRSISLFAANDGYECAVKYGFGYASWEKNILGQKVETTAFIPMDANARVLIIKGAEGINLNWLLKPLMAESEAGLNCRFENGVFYCQNSDSFFEDMEFKTLCSSFANCRSDFVPAAMLMNLECEAVTVLVCGCDELEKLQKLSQPKIAEAALEECRRHWNKLTGKVRISTNIPSLDRYINGWAAYQSIACRLWARGSLYQAGGAFGFRDQLQDTVNMLLIEPNFAKAQILLCCKHQYTEGDVMHWWHAHPNGDKGLRSRCSDDMLWLVWALCQYTEATGDYEICADEANYVNSLPLSVQEHDRYEIAIEGKSDSFLNHAKAALDCCINRGFGPHGLPFFGSGDWNDGLDNVDGESVWLGWFLSLCADAFSQLLKVLCKPEFEYYHRIAEQVGKAADLSFNGRFYRRGYLSDGSALGGEERIDSLPQSFAALSPYASKDKVQTALENALNSLVDEKNKLVKLFTPPYSGDEPYYGYISSYGQGFRENGGQYTHGAVWLAMACFEQGMTDKAFEILQMLLPENHDLSIYGAEPYVLAADVYSAFGRCGEAGWSWYTGSAGWYFRLVTEKLLGIKLSHGKTEVNPALPKKISNCSVTLKDDKGAEKRYKFTN